jgi:glycosyl transferase family 25
MSLDTYLINLDRSPERYLRIRDLLAAMDLKVHRVPAVDGRRLKERTYPAPARSRAMPAERIIINRFEIALVLSHRRALRRFLRTSEDRCVILEDDVYFGEGYPDVVQALQSTPLDFDLIKLETFRRPVVTSRIGGSSIAGRRISRLLSTHMGTAGYLVSRDGARKILARSAGAPLGFDSILFDFDRMRVSGLEPLRIGQLDPAIIIQHDLLDDAPAANAHLASLIGVRPPRALKTGRMALSRTKLTREATRPFRKLWLTMRARAIDFR